MQFNGKFAFPDVIIIFRHAAVKSEGAQTMRKEVILKYADVAALSRHADDKQEAASLYLMQRLSFGQAQ